jgi:hypothetical protein
LLELSEIATIEEMRIDTVEDRRTNKEGEQRLQPGQNAQHRGAVPIRAPSIGLK